MQLDIPADLDLNPSEPELEDFNVGVEIAKSLTISAAQTAGLVGGFVVVALAYDAGTKLYRRFWKKDERPKLHVVTDLPLVHEN